MENLKRWKFIYSHQTVLVNLVIFALNFIISIIYAKNLTVENRGVLAAAVLYPQLAIKEFAWHYWKFEPSPSI